MLENKYTIGEVDSVTGPLIGRPKSATFRTLDVVGLDTFSHVARNVYEQVEGKEKIFFSCLSLWKECLKKGGSAAKQGKDFIKKWEDHFRA
ncbi:3-hydroxyacyl-CoA dehydrogenase family protein [Bacillus sp. B6(2022)]|nr:3-hydroxyacyl-CoA dehydrogenase family protein [Bacillus sp. B6(2022)]